MNARSSRRSRVAPAVAVAAVTGLLLSLVGCSAMQPPIVFKIVGMYLGSQPRVTSQSDSLAYPHADISEDQETRLGLILTATNAVTNTNKAKELVEDLKEYTCSVHMWGLAGMASEPTISDGQVTTEWAVAAGRPRAGLHSGTLTCHLYAYPHESTASVDFTIDLTSTQPETPVASVSPTSLDFGSQPIGTQSIGTQSTKSVTVTRQQGRVEIDKYSLSDASSFRVANSTCSQALTASSPECSIDLVFSPTSAGEKSDTFTIFTNDGEKRVRLVGVGVSIDGPVFVATPDPLDFGTVALPSSPPPPQDVTITNSGNQDLRIIGDVTINPDDNWAIQNDGCKDATIAPGAAGCVVQVFFNPRMTGKQSALLTFITNAGTHTVTATVEVTGAGLTVSPDAVDFGPVAVGTNSPATTITVTSTGDVSLLTDPAFVDGPDASQFQITEDGCTGVPVEPGQSCTLKVRFNPTGPGDAVAGVNLYSNAPPNLQYVPLSGTGT